MKTELHKYKKCRLGLEKELVKISDVRTSLAVLYLQTKSEISKLNIAITGLEASR